MSKEEKSALVIDTTLNEEYPAKEHDVIVDGAVQTIAFRLGKDTILPYKMALKFMKDGFIVRELEDGYDINLPPVAAENVTQQLAHDECVAKYEELTMPALKVRAAQRIGGEIFLEAEDADKKDIVNFLSGAAPITDQEEVAEPQSKGDITVTEELDEIDVGDTDEDQEKIEEQLALLREHYGVIDFLPADKAEDGATIYEGADAEGNIVVAGTILELSEKALADIENEEAEQQPEDKAEPKAHDQPQPQEINASDSAVKLAEKHGIDLKTVKPTGKDGIIKADVEKAVEEKIAQEKA